MSMSLRFNYYLKNSQFTIAYRYNNLTMMLYLYKGIITMKKIIITIALTLLTLSSANAAHPMCGKTELADLMDTMKDNMKAIKMAAKSSDTDEVTKIANELLLTVQKSQKFVPLSISDKTELTADQKADFSKYQKGMKALEKAVTDLSLAKTAAQQKEALAVIGKSAKKGHKAFKMDCDK